MDKAKINDLYEQAHVVHEISYESSVVDPSIVSVYKQRVFDRYLFAKLIVQECCDVLYDNELGGYQANYVLKEHFGAEE